MTRAASPRLGGPRNVAVRYLDDGTLAVIPFPPPTAQGTGHDGLNDPSPGSGPPGR